MIKAPVSTIGRRGMLRAMLGFALVFTASQPAGAHAVLVSSEPAAGAKVLAGKVTFTLRFNSRIDRSRSRVDLLGANGEHHALTIYPGGSEDTVQVTLIAAPGGNTLRWQVLATDGHITRGEVAFVAERP